MTTIEQPEDINRPRRRLFGVAAVTIAAAQLGVMAAARAQSGDGQPMPSPRSGMNTSFAPLKQIDAGLLNIAYAEAGPADGPPVILLHGGSGSSDGSVGSNSRRWARRNASMRRLRAMVKIHELTADFAGS